jgi:L-alanine-DL-glutamate epimerase-like enolase superfamily enzyme
MEREARMKISGMEVSLHRLPLKEPWGDSTHRITHIELILCKLSTDTSHNGVGYSYTVGSGGAAVATLMRAYLTPIVVGEDPSYIERLWRRLWQECHDAGARGIGGLAINAIDVALWDLAGKTAGKPLFQLLGGARERITAYGSGVNLNLSQDELLAQVEGWLSRGYEAVKVKVGSKDPGEDVERIEAVRELIGQRRHLMVDANQAWTVSEAVTRTRMLEPYRPYWIEEPLISDDVLGHARLRGAVSTAIAVGENIHSRFEMATYVQLGAVDVVQADVVRIGGITEWLKVAHMADAFNLKVAPHFVLELSGSVLCAVPNALILEDVEGGSLTELGVLEEPLPVKNGYWAPPRRPGHGIVFGQSALDKTEIRGEELEARTTRRYDL